MDKLDISCYFKDLQNRIVLGLEDLDGSAKFVEDIWQREEGGGGITKILQNGSVFEKGGVNFSEVEGFAPKELLSTLEVSLDQNTPVSFYATGISIVMHPDNPMVPIIHMNVRYFELKNDVGMITNWFGGGIDLTPHYISNPEASFFHKQLKKTCDLHDPTYYPKFKEWADNYFYIKHRKETRGIGGIFFDRLTALDNNSFSRLFDFVKSVGECFLPTYTSIVNVKKGEKYDSDQKLWQKIRRGRYVEFNLVYDRGTTFGLQTNGRTESILMSLPQDASWFYDFKTEIGSAEEATLKSLSKGIDWINK